MARCTVTPSRHTLLTAAAAAAGRVGTRQDFLADGGAGGEVEMEAEDADGCWEIVDGAPEVRAVDSADNSPASSSRSDAEECDAELELELDEGDLADGEELDGEGELRRSPSPTKSLAMRRAVRLIGEEGEGEGEGEGNEDSRRLRLERLSKDSQSAVAMDIRIGLKEPPKDSDRFQHLVEILGAETASEAFAATMRQEESGGVLSGQGQRRTPGGAFFELLKNFATEEQMRAINKFRKDKQRASARNKAVNEVARAGGLRPHRTAGHRGLASSTPGSRSPSGSAIAKKRERSPGTGGKRGHGDARRGGKKQQQRQLCAPNRQRGEHKGSRRLSVQRTPRAQTAPRQCSAEQGALVI